MACNCLLTYVARPYLPFISTIAFLQYLDVYLTRVDSLIRQISWLVFSRINYGYKGAVEFLSPQLGTEELLLFNAYWAKLECNIGKDLAAGHGVRENALEKRTSVWSRVRLIKGTDGRTTITMNWGNFMRAAAIKKGDIFAFIFTVRCNKLRLTVNRLSHIDGRLVQTCVPSSCIQIF